MTDQNGTFGPGPHRLLVNGRDVAPLVVADDRKSRRRGLLGSTELIGALWITKCPSVHMIGMKYAIDVASLDKSGRVLAVKTLRPGWGMTLPRLRVSATLEAPAGALVEWGVTVGDTLSTAS
ncbi:DUF192 domain-containing protein [Luteipulveratus halotolerans]|uniref:DUF192 domain-containing protein n=1 Tax=Luteipulveratus halotolerans TaxID=1631356 RepID=UPI000682A06A|nr:DUF192 domain-containing protein [Luteipulveratus halotolerans]